MGLGVFIFILVALLRLLFVPKPQVEVRCMRTIAVRGHVSQTKSPRHPAIRLKSYWAGFPHRSTVCSKSKALFVIFGFFSKTLANNIYGIYM